MALLHSHDVQVHEVAVHLPVSGRRVPAAHGQNLQALHGLLRTTDETLNSFKAKMISSFRPPEGLLTFQSLFCGWRGTRGRSLLPGRMCSGGVQSICSISMPFFFRFPVSAGTDDASKGTFVDFYTLRMLQINTPAVICSATHGTTVNT